MIVSQENQEIQRAVALKMERFAQQRYGKTYRELHSTEAGVCALIAEMMVYPTFIIHPEYRKLNIFDFTGITKGSKNPILDEPTIEFAINSVAEYCWGLLYADIMALNDGRSYQQIREVLDEHLELPLRKKGRNNVVIYGNKNERVGRSMLASIIMSEIIRSRRFETCHSDAYAWLRWNRLVEIVNNRWNDEIKINHYRYADWLVVEDISETVSEYHTGTIFSSRDSEQRMKAFFDGRVSDGLVTIFTFRFDIAQEDYDIEKMFGCAVKGVLFEIEGNNRTTVIPLFAG